MFQENILKQIKEKAAYYDKNNLFPIEDYQLLKDSGYYKAMVPKSLGGLGLSLKEICAYQTILSKNAPATALGINMHQIIVGVGKHLLKFNNQKGEKILKDAADNKLIAFAISEPSNDKVLFGSNTKVTKVEKGYLFNGKKVFLSMANEADYLITYGDFEGNSIFAYIKNNTPGIEIINDWDTLGMRATQSCSVNFNNLFVSEEDIIQILPKGPSLDPIVFGIFAYFEILLAATYLGIGKRAVEIGVEKVKNRHSYINDTTYDKDKNIRWRIAEAALSIEGIDVLINNMADLIENENQFNFSYFPKLSALKNKAVESSKRAVEEIVRACGGASYYNSEELSRLLRDVYAGLFQPSDQESLHDAWANMLLGPIK